MYRTIWFHSVSYGSMYRSIWFHRVSYGSMYRSIWFHVCAITALTGTQCHLEAFNTYCTSAGHSCSGGCHGSKGLWAVQPPRELCPVDWHGRHCTVCKVGSGVYLLSQIPLDCMLVCTCMCLSLSALHMQREVATSTRAACSDTQHRLEIVLTTYNSV